MSGFSSRGILPSVPSFSALRGDLRMFKLPGDHLMAFCYGIVVTIAAPRIDVPRFHYQLS